MLKEENKIKFNLDSEYEDFLKYKYNLNKINYDIKKQDVHKKYQKSKRMVKVGLFFSLMLSIVPGFLQYNHIGFLTPYYPNLIMATFVGCLTAFFSVGAVENFYAHKKEKLDKEMLEHVIEKDVMDYIVKEYGKEFVEFLLVKYKMQIPYSVIINIEKEKMDMIESENVKNKAKIITTKIYE